MAERKTEAELFLELRAGRSGSWDELVERLGPIVYAVPRRMGLSAADAEEVTQATWLALYRHAKWITKPHSIVSWILTTAARETARAHRTARRREEIEESGAASADVDPLPSPSEVVERLERIAIVRAALESLDAPCAALLEALYVERESSYRRIAERLGMPVGSIGPTRQRCLEKLERKLAGTPASELPEDR